MKSVAILSLFLVAGLTTWVQAGNTHYSQISCTINRAQLTVDIAQKKAYLDGKKLANIDDIQTGESSLSLLLNNPDAHDIQQVIIQVPPAASVDMINSMVITQTDYRDVTQTAYHECVLSK